MRDTDIAWAAGLFEGEGTMSTFREVHQIRASLSSIDRDVLERFHEIVSVGRIEKQKVTNAYKILWRWSANMGDAEHVIRLMLPHFGTRRAARATELLAARAAHIEAVTYERECNGCGKIFRPAFSPNSRRQAHCSVVCYQHTTGRVLSRLAARRRNPQWRIRVTP